MSGNFMGKPKDFHKKRDVVNITSLYFYSTAQNSILPIFEKTHFCDQCEKLTGHAAHQKQIDHNGAIDK
jgi:hypothetical protein